MESDATYSPDVNALLQARLESITSKMYQAMDNFHFQLPVLIDAVNQMVYDCLSKSLESSSQIASKLSAEILPLFAERLKELSEIYSQSGAFVDVPNEMLESLSNLEPFVPEENREEFKEIIAPTKEGNGKLLTFDNIYKLMSLIAAIVTIIYYTYDMAVKVSENKHQQTDNDIKQKEIELRENELELFREFFEYIKENGICFPGQPDGLFEQVDPFCNQADGLNHCVVPDVQGDDDKALDDVQNSQE